MRYKVEIKEGKVCLDDSLNHKRICDFDGHMEQVSLICDLLNNMYEKNKEMRIKAYNDPLTKCFNRNYYDYVAKNKYKNKDVYAAVVDLNKLKETNDKFGHSKGDTIIKQVSSILQNYGEVIRWGGDEFILTMTDEATAKLFEEESNKQDMYAWGMLHKKESDNFVDILNQADKIMLDKKEKMKSKK